MFCFLLASSMFLSVNDIYHLCYIKYSLKTDNALGVV